MISEPALTSTRHLYPVNHDLGHGRDQGMTLECMPNDALTAGVDKLNRPTEPPAESEWFGGEDESVMLMVTAYWH